MANSEEFVDCSHLEGTVVLELQNVPSIAQSVISVPRSVFSAPRSVHGDDFGSFRGVSHSPGLSPEAPPTTIFDSGIGKFFIFNYYGKRLVLELDSVRNTPPHVTHEDDGELLMLSSVGRGETKRRTTVDIMKEQRKEKKTEKIKYLLPESTNEWLYIAEAYVPTDKDDNGCVKCLKQCTDNTVNKLIAIFVIFIQVAAYSVMTLYLWNSREEDQSSRRQNCNGPNCDSKEPVCMSIATGGLTSILLVGFLWADVVNAFSLCCKSRRWFLASILVIFELFLAIGCGFLVGLLSKNDFDAIGGAVGILFVHDLDEKVYASMQVFRHRKCATIGKVVGFVLWLILSLGAAYILSCTYEDGQLIGDCKETEFQCGSGECIWEGFVCNGVSDCADKSDEFSFNIGYPPHEACDYSLIECPGPQTQDIYDVDCDAETDGICAEEPTHFMCESDGSCISWGERCDGVIDCDDGSDEGRAQNCATVLATSKCNEALSMITLNDSYSEQWSGMFKCNNGQCIDAAYACDGIPGDCVDESDEYPNFNKARESPWLVSCPYDKLITCDSTEVLCKIDGRCISKSAVCDGSIDCPDGADEKGCEYSCKDDVLNNTKFQCGGHIAKVNDTHLIEWIDEYAQNTDINGYTIQLQDAADTDLNALFVGATGNCIPISWRCDGTEDCEDGTDEELCVLFACAEDEYQCSDNGKCIPISWLCDSSQDCNNAEDEREDVCKEHGINPENNACIAQGYDYQCDDCDHCCLYRWELCDGVPDCPNGDDELTETCDAIQTNDFLNTSSYIPGANGEFSCGDTVNGTADKWESMSWYFTLPSSGVDYIRISTCHTAMGGAAYMELADDEWWNSYEYTYLWSQYDDDCSCSARALLLGDTEHGLTPGNKYILDVMPFFYGNYMFTVECDSSPYSGGDIGGATCNDSTIFSQGYVPGGSGTVYCGDTMTGIAQDDHLSFSFTFPSGYTYMKVSSCHSENEGPGYFDMSDEKWWMYDDFTYLYTGMDENCSCGSRGYLLANTEDGLTPGASYVIDYLPYFHGNYMFTVECGNSPYSGGVGAGAEGCVESDVEAAYIPGGNGVVECGDIITGTNSTEDYWMSFFFTVPSSGYSYLKASTCYSENEGLGYLDISDWLLVGALNSAYIGSGFDDDCDCVYRALLLADIGTEDGLIPGGLYTIDYWTHFGGTYKFSIECGSSPLLGGAADGTQCIDDPDWRSAVPDWWWEYYGYTPYDYSSGGTTTSVLP